MLVQVFVLVCLSRVAMGACFDQELVARLQQTYGQNAAVVPDIERYKLIENLQDWIKARNANLLNMPRNYDILVVMDIRLSNYLSKAGIVDVGNYTAYTNLVVDLPASEAKKDDFVLSGMNLLQIPVFEQFGTPLSTLANYAIEAFMRNTLTPFTSECRSAALEVQPYSIGGSNDMAEIGVLAAFYISSKDIGLVKFL